MNAYLCVYFHFPYIDVRRQVFDACNFFTGQTIAVLLDE